MPAEVVPAIESAANFAAKKEVLQSLAPRVEENLQLLLPVERAWQPSDMLPDLTGEDWSQQLATLRDPAKALPDEVLVVLVGGMVTEEALPSYSVSLNLIACDYEGDSPAPWPRWLRGWTAEENRHGDTLNAYLRLTGRVDMRAIEVTIHNLLHRGFNPRAYPDLYGGLVYTSFQERATFIAHTNVGRHAAANNDTSLARICRRIAGDESRHENFYTRMMGFVFDADPNGAMITFRDMLRRQISMPGRYMFDGKDVNLFDHFAAVAQRCGVYTVADYADIIERLCTAWKVADRSVTGAAAAAQDYLARAAERYRRLVEPVQRLVKESPPVSFTWLSGRTA